MNKKIIILIGIVVCFLGISVPAMAETTSRRANIKSFGNLDFDNGTVYFTSSDLIYLADEIDNLEDTYKQTSVDALNAVGTFFLSDGTIVNNCEQNEVDTDEKKSALSFESILEGIKKSQSLDSLSQTQVTDKDGNLLFYETEEAKTNKDIYSLTTTDTGFPAFYQPVSADNLSAGTAAWVDGTLIKGNGSVNAAYYAQGVVDGMANFLDNLEVEYTYHEHNDSCYTEVPDGIATMNKSGSADRYCCIHGLTNSHWLYDGVTLKSGKWFSNVWICKQCGKIIVNGANNSGTVYGYSWGTYKSMTCGKTEESIESVTIKY